MLSKKKIGQPGRQQEHFSFSYQLLVFFLVSTTPHGWERLASRGDTCSRESRIYQGERTKLKTTRVNIKNEDDFNIDKTVDNLS